MKTALTLLLSICCFTLSFAASDSSPDSAAEVVYLRVNCQEGGTQIQNCFESMSELTGDGTTGWVWATRAPGPTEPLLIDIGPGTFGPFNCVGTVSSPRGWVSLRGSGREHTVVQSGAYADAISVKDCDQLAFQDLTARLSLNGAFTAVRWLGGGKGTWTDVDLVAENHAGPSNNAWFDGGSGPLGEAVCNVHSLHYFFGARLRASGSTDITYAFGGNCSDTWFYGGEIFTDLFPVSGTDTSAEESVNLYTAHKFQAFGTALRLSVTADDRTSFNTSFPINVSEANVVPNVWLFGYDSSYNPVFHMHGGVISSSSTVPGTDIIGLLTDGSGTHTHAHTPDTAFKIEAGPAAGSDTAIPYRLRNTSTSHWMIESPFMWGSMSKPPLATDETTNVLISIDGADMYVENDCSPAGDCDSYEGPHGSHLMVLNTARCSSEKWFNTTTGQCRGVTANTIQDLIERIEQLEQEP